MHLKKVVASSTVNILRAYLFHYVRGLMLDRHLNELVEGIRLHFWVYTHRCLKPHFLYGVRLKLLINGGLVTQWYCYSPNTGGIL